MQALRLRRRADPEVVAQAPTQRLVQMLAGLPSNEQDAVWGEIEAALREFEGPDGFVGPCELLVAGGSAGTA